MQAQVVSTLQLSLLPPPLPMTPLRRSLALALLALAACGAVVIAALHSSRQNGDSMAQADLQMKPSSQSAQASTLQSPSSSAQPVDNIHPPVHYTNHWSPPPPPPSPLPPSLNPYRFIPDADFRWDKYTYHNIDKAHNVRPEDPTTATGAAFYVPA